MGRAMTEARRLLRGTRGAMAMTVSQLFLGAVSLGVGLLRGSDVHAALHQESLVGHADYAASKLAVDHARAANIVVDDNVVMTAIMGPRFAVEADVITMSANAAIACPTCPKGHLCPICKEVKSNMPRAKAKLAWVRGEQQALWRTLGKLSGDLDALVARQAAELATSEVKRVDPLVAVRLADPAQTHVLWGAANTSVACDLAVEDTLPSPLLGHAFPVLVSKNLLSGLPRTLVQAMPQKLCALASASVPKPDLGDIREVADKTRDDCRDREQQVACAVAAARGQPGACRGDELPDVASLDDRLDDTRPAAASTSRAGRVVLPREAERFVSCKVGSPSAPLSSSESSGYSYRDAQGRVVTCTFDRDECMKDRLGENSDDYLNDKLDLPKVPSSVASLVGGSETRAPTAGGSSPEDFCACAYASRPVDETVIGITDAVRRIASFGAAGPSEALRRPREYRSCAKWYFPDRLGPFAAVPADEQPFVAAWKWAPVASCKAGEP